MLKNKKRLSISIIAGAILGIVCIIGVGSRFGFAGNEVFLFATWYNRLLMGILIGFIGSCQMTKSKFNPLLRGAVTGAIVSFALFASTNFIDPLGFGAGIVYGIIIDYAATKYS